MTRAQVKELAAIACEWAEAVAGMPEASAAGDVELARADLRRRRLEERYADRLAACSVEPHGARRTGGIS